MRKTGRKLAGMLLTAVLVVSMGITSFGFYQQPANKKGLLVNAQMFDDFLELGCSQMEVNLASYQPVDGFVWLAEKCKANNISFTMILLNNFGAHDSNLLPVSEPVAGAGNYAFNSATPEGEAAVRNYAKQLAYTYKELVSNWVIGNEVNDALAWDYDGTTDIDSHAAAYAKTFRIFYEEITAANPEARVFISFDRRWNTPNNEPLRYTSREFLTKLNALLSDTNYGVAWHPYPIEWYISPEFMDTPNEVRYAINSPDALVVDMRNINVLTDYLQRPEMLAPDGSVRHVILSEQGFTSKGLQDTEHNEARQAAAIKQAYEIANANPYIEAFILERQVDANGQVTAGGAFGLWYNDPNAAMDETPTTRKQAWYTYQSLQ